MATQSELDALLGKWHAELHGYPNEYSFILNAWPIYIDGKPAKAFDVKYLSVRGVNIKIVNGTLENVHMFDSPIKGTDDIRKLSKKAIRGIFKYG